MQLIGFLGGMSWESTAEYYRLANELVRDRCGGLHSARCVTYSVDFAGIERMQADGSWEEAARSLALAGQSLAAAGADFLVLCTNTMHKIADAVTDAIDIPLLHIGDTTAAAVTSAGLGRVGLIGTGFTMSQPFYADRLTSSGLDVVVPSEEDQAIVHRIIYDELCLGVIRDESRRSTGGSSGASSRREPRASSTGAPRSSCSWARRTVPCLPSPPLGCTSKLLSTGPWEAPRSGVPSCPSVPSSRPHAAPPAEALSNHRCCKMLEYVHELTRSRTWRPSKSYSAPSGSFSDLGLSRTRPPD